MSSTIATYVSEALHWLHSVNLHRPFWIVLSTYESSLPITCRPGVRRGRKQSYVDSAYPTVSTTFLFLSRLYVALGEAPLFVHIECGACSVETRIPLGSWVQSRELKLDNGADAGSAESALLKRDPRR